MTGRSGEARIDWVHSVLRHGLIRGGMEIEKFAILRQRLDPVREALCNQQATLIGRRQEFGMPSQECGGVPAHVYRYVEYLSAQTRHELSLRVRRSLKVHAADVAAVPRERMVNLCQWLLDPGSRKLLGTIDPRQEAPAVLDRLTLYHDHAGQWRRNELTASQPT